MTTRASESVGAAEIPSLDALLRDAHFAPSLAEYGRSAVTSMLRSHLATVRERALAHGLEASDLLSAAIASTIGDLLQKHNAPKLRAVFNLTGTVIHTNLGRSLLPDTAIDAVARAMRAPVNLEFDLDAGQRGDRDDIVCDLICELTGAEAATVVNNNAAAVLLVLKTFAQRRECIVSRGELVEIGGSFRIPDVMRSAGAKLVEVGTTNRTHSGDYDNAIGPRTGLLMKVHASNYAISGFTSNVSVADLSAMGRERGVPLAVDLGSGSLIDLSQWNLPREPTVRETIAAGADLVTFSGDKLLGGPQAGLIAGRSDLIGKLKKNPLKRALRAGKMTIAALEAVLALYRAPEFLAERLTTLRLLTRETMSMKTQALRLKPVLQKAFGAAYEVADEAMPSQIGSGALPIDHLPSYGLVVRVAKGKRGSLDRLDAELRALPRPVLGRIVNKALWLDLRCLEAADEATFVAQLEAWAR